MTDNLDNYIPGGTNRTSGTYDASCYKKQVLIGEKNEVGVSKMFRLPGGCI